MNQSYFIYLPVIFIISIAAGTVAACYLSNPFNGSVSNYFLNVNEFFVNVNGVSHRSLIFPH